MIIEEKDFRLTPINDHSIFFDVEYKATVRAKGKEPREEWKILGYGMPLDSAIKHIAAYRIQKHFGESSIGLVKYIKAYQKISDAISKLCNAEIKEKADLLEV